MLTKEYMDKLFGDHWDHWRIANKVTREFIGGGLPYDHILPAGLSCIAVINEREEKVLRRYPGYAPSWAVSSDPDYLPLESTQCWHIEIPGLLYKSSSSYLTAEGYPLGTTCWYSKIECGGFYMAAHEKAEEAVLRAVIIACALNERRKRPPGDQEKIFTILERMSKLK